MGKTKPEGRNLCLVIYGWSSGCSRVEWEGPLPHSPGFRGLVVLREVGRTPLSPVCTQNRPGESEESKTKSRNFLNSLMDMFFFITLKVQ